jgi:hypothetical protein
MQDLYSTFNEDLGKVVSPVGFKEAQAERAGAGVLAGSGAESGADVEVGLDSGEENSKIA